jgi:hypothetical protein
LIESAGEAAITAWAVSTPAACRAAGDCSTVTDSWSSLNSSMIRLASASSPHTMM